MKRRIKQNIQLKNVKFLIFKLFYKMNVECLNSKIQENKEILWKLHKMFVETGYKNTSEAFWVKFYSFKEFQ